MISEKLFLKSEETKVRLTQGVGLWNKDMRRLIGVEGVAKGFSQNHVFVEINGVEFVVPQTYIEKV